MLPRKIAPPPPVRVWVWLRVSFGVGGQFSSGAIDLEPLCRLVTSIKIVLARHNTKKNRLGKKLTKSYLLIGKTHQDLL